MLHLPSSIDLHRNGAFFYGWMRPNEWNKNGIELGQNTSTTHTHRNYLMSQIYIFISSWISIEHNNAVVAVLVIVAILLYICMRQLERDVEISISFISFQFSRCLIHLFFIWQNECHKFVNTLRSRYTRPYNYRWCKMNKGDFRFCADAMWQHHRNNSVYKTLKTSSKRTKIAVTRRAN